MRKRMLSICRPTARNFSEFVGMTWTFAFGSCKFLMIKCVRVRYLYVRTGVKVSRH